MGLFSSRPELNNTWAAIPGEPLDGDDPTPTIGDALTQTRLGVIPAGGDSSISIDLTSFSAPAGTAEVVEDVSSDGDGD